MSKLNGKVALVTGAGAGLGKGIATSLAKDGAKVVLVGRREDKLKAVKQEIGDQAIVLPTDATDEKQVADLVESLKEKTDGKLDILVNNAGGVIATGMVTDMTLEDWNNMLALNATTQFLMTKACLPMLRESDNGKVISVTSGMVNFFMDGMSAYSASKAAAESFMKAVAEEEKKHNVQVNMFDPLNVKSEGNPDGQYEASEIVGIINELAAAPTMEKQGEVVKPNV